MAGTAPIKRTEAAAESAVITPHDTTTIQPMRGIYVGVSGNIYIKHSADSAIVPYLNVPVGILPVTCVIVRATNTTATDMVAMY